jgi:hypothetical protein
VIAGGDTSATRSSVSQSHSNDCLMWVAQVLSVTTIGPPATLTLEPKQDVNVVDSEHCVTATVKDAFGNPTPGITVRFSVSGSVNTSGSSVTDANGQATFCYTGPPLPGSDVITAFADTNNNGTQDPRRTE